LLSLNNNEYHLITFEIYKQQEKY